MSHILRSELPKPLVIVIIRLLWSKTIFLHQSNSTELNETIQISAILWSWQAGVRPVAKPGTGTTTPSLTCATGTRLCPGKTTRAFAPSIDITRSRFHQQFKSSFLVRKCHTYDTFLGHGIQQVWPIFFARTPNSIDKSTGVRRKLIK